MLLLLSYFPSLLLSYVKERQRDSSTLPPNPHPPSTPPPEPAFKRVYSQHNLPLYCVASVPAMRHAVTSGNPSRYVLFVPFQRIVSKAYVADWRRTNKARCHPSTASPSIYVQHCSQEGRPCSHR